MLNTIEVRGLTKRYRSTLAVDGLEFDVRPGAVTGFLGPNGAGKSTTMRMILGLIGLFGLGLGAIVRHSAAALAVYVGVVFVVGQFLVAFAKSILPYVPLAIFSNSLGASRPEPDALSPWTALGVLSLYAVATLAAGTWQLTHKDA